MPYLWRACPHETTRPCRHRLCEEAQADAAREVSAGEGDAGSDTLPDGTTILDSATCRKPIASRPGCLPINALLAGTVLLLREGATIDATLIAAPPSTRNRDGRHDPEMSQTKKGKQWGFGMKAHIGVDDQSGLVHTVVGITAKVSDMSRFGELLQGEEECVSAPGPGASADPRASGREPDRGLGGPQDQASR